MLTIWRGFSRAQERFLLAVGTEVGGTAVCSCVQGAQASLEEEEMSSGLVGRPRLFLSLAET